MFSKEISKCPHMLLHPEVGDIAAILGKNLRSGHTGGRTLFIGVAKKKFTWFKRRPRARCRLHSGSFDHRLRESVAVTEVFVCIVKRWDRFQIEGGKEFDSIALRHIAFVLLSAPLTFGDIACKQYGNSMKVWTCQASNPVIRMVGTC